AVDSCDREGDLRPSARPRTTCVFSTTFCAQWKPVGPGSSACRLCCAPIAVFRVTRGVGVYDYAATVVFFRKRASAAGHLGYFITMPWVSVGIDLC
ncbi:hypothetical protein ACJX0J_041883, partial [Zea mays]